MPASGAQAALAQRGIAKERLVALGSGESVRSSESSSDRVVDFLVLVWDEAQKSALACRGAAAVG